MAAKAIVAALVLLAVVAALDGARPSRDAPSQAAERATAASGAKRRGGSLELVAGRAAHVRAAGSYLRKRVVRDGRTYLTEGDVAGAFPLPLEGPFDIAHLAVAPDGTLVLAVYGFSPHGRARGAIELWNGRAAAGAFIVPSGSFGGGLAFSRDGSLIATFGRDGEIAGLFDRRGRDVSDAA